MLPAHQQAQPFYLKTQKERSWREVRRAQEDRSMNRNTSANKINKTNIIILKADSGDKIINRNVFVSSISIAVTVMESQC